MVLQMGLVRSTSAPVKILVFTPSPYNSSSRAPEGDKKWVLGAGVGSPKSCAC